MEAIDLSLSILLTLFLIAVLAGFIDTLVGGGGLITIPALLMCGMSPLSALGTNKMQAVAGSGTASFMMLKRRRVNFDDVKTLMIYAFIGSLFGSIFVQYINPGALQILIPIVIVVIALYFLLAPSTSLEATKPMVGEASYRVTAVPAIGCYDGMFGPATGSFFVLAGVSLRGQEVIHATAVAKTLNFATNIASLLVFMVYGKIVFIVAGVMMLGQLVGANLGARYLLKIDPSVLRYLLVIMSFIMLLIWLLR